MRKHVHLFRTPPILVFGILFVSGCTSVLRQSYRDIPAGPGTVPLPYSGTSLVYGSVEPDNDAARLTQDGFIRIGISSFKTDGPVSFDDLQAQAKAVGADIVLFSKRRPGSLQALRPLAQNSDGTPHALESYVHVTGSVTLFGANYGGAFSVGGGMSDFKGKVTSSGIPGVSAADMAAINAPEFEYTATFWRKIRPS